MLKRQLRLLMRRVRDVRSGTYGKMARKPPAAPVAAAFGIEIRQDIRPGPTLAQKRANIELAARHISGVVLQPGQLLSFWALVGPPSARRGFQSSRNIVKGRVSTAIGGGICQVSGMLYHLALLGGLEVTERHAHSVDIYAEAERFTPLGADATVVYGYKDLRIKNLYDFPILFSLEVRPDGLWGALRSPQPLAARDVVFERSEKADSKRVVTAWRDESGQRWVLAESEYGKFFGG